MPFGFFDKILCQLPYQRTVGNIFEVLYLLIPWSAMFVLGVVMVVLSRRPFEGLNLTPLQKHHKIFIISYLISFPVIILICWLPIIVEQLLYVIDDDKMEPFIEGTGEYIANLAFLNGFLFIS